MTYSITLAAQSDIEHIVTALWEENPKAAELIEERLYQAFDLLASNAGLKRFALELNQGIPKGSEM